MKKISAEIQLWLKSFLALCSIQLSLGAVSNDSILKITKQNNILDRFIAIFRLSFTELRLMPLCVTSISKEKEMLCGGYSEKLMPYATL